jgi:hypothetical protein
MGVWVLMSPLVKFTQGRCLPCKQGRMGLDAGGWPFPVDVSIDHPAPSRCCRSAPLSRSPSPSCLLQRLTRLRAARTINVCFNVEARAPLIRFLQRPPLHRRQPFASRCQLRRTGDEAANLTTRCRPCRFSRLRRVCPQTTLWACCIPLPIMGFTRFPAESRRCRRHPTFLTGAITLRSFPLLAEWTPSPTHCWVVHRMSCPSRGWPSFFPRTGRNLHTV